MEAKDVRLNNLVLLDGIVTEIGITQIMNFAFYEKHEKEFYNIRWTPIELTEEWLLKFGFKKVQDSEIENWGHFENKDCWVYLISDGFEFELNTGDERHNLYRQYKYVHQLQNLYFALTGKELELINQ